MLKYMSVSTTVRKIQFADTFVLVLRAFTGVSFLCGLQRASCNLEYDTVDYTIRVLERYDTSALHSVLLYLREALVQHAVGASLFLA